MTKAATTFCLLFLCLAGQSQGFFSKNIWALKVQAVKCLFSYDPEFCENVTTTTTTTPPPPTCPKPVTFSHLIDKASVVPNLDPKTITDLCFLDVYRCNEHSDCAEGKICCPVFSRSKPDEPKCQICIYDHENRRNQLP